MIKSSFFRKGLARFLSAVLITTTAFSAAMPVGAIASEEEEVSSQGDAGDMEDEEPYDDKVYDDEDESSAQESQDAYDELTQDSEASDASAAADGEVQTASDAAPASVADTGAADGIYVEAPDAADTSVENVLALEDDVDDEEDDDLEVEEVLDSSDMEVNGVEEEDAEGRDGCKANIVLGDKVVSIGGDDEGVTLHNDAEAEVAWAEITEDGDYYIEAALVQGSLTDKQANNSVISVASGVTARLVIEVPCSFSNNYGPDHNNSFEHEYFIEGGEDCHLTIETVGGERDQQVELSYFKGIVSLAEGSELFMPADCKIYIHDFYNTAIDVQGDVTLGNEEGEGKLDLDIAGANYDGADVYTDGSAIRTTGGDITILSGDIDINGVTEDGVFATDGDVTVEGGELRINGCLEGYAGISAEKLDKKSMNCSVNIEGGEISITEGEGGGIFADDIYINGGETYINCYNGESAYLTYTSAVGPTEYNDIVKEDGVTVETIRRENSVHNAILAGAEGASYVFEADPENNFKVDGYGSFNMTGGKLTIDTKDTGLKASKADENCQRDVIPASNGLYIFGDPDDAILSYGTVDISGGELNIETGGNGISCPGDVKIYGNGTKVDIGLCFEGIEGRNIYIGKKDEGTGPSVAIHSLDDAVNASSKTVEYKYRSSREYDAHPLYGYEKKSTSLAENKCKVRSGNVDVFVDSEHPLRNIMNYNFFASGDGIDCNGSFEMWYDSRVRVFGASTGDDEPIDADDGFTFTSGPIVLATGVDDDNKSVPTRGAGVYLVWGGADASYSFPAGAHFVVRENKDGGKVLYDTDEDGPVLNGDEGVEVRGLPYSGSFIIFGHPDLKVGEGYVVSVGDEEKIINAQQKDTEDPEDTDDDDSGKKDDDEVGGEKTITITCEDGNSYTITYTSSIYYTGAKITLPTISINGAKEGGSFTANAIEQKDPKVSANSIVGGTMTFKKAKYKNNKKVGTAMIRANIKADKTSDKELKKRLRKAAKALTNYFKKNPLTFEIVQRPLRDEEIKVESAVYKEKSKKWKFKITCDTGVTSKNGKKKLLKLKFNDKKPKKGDFTISENSLDIGAKTVVIVGKNNFKGTYTVKNVTIK